MLRKYGNAVMTYRRGEMLFKEKFLLRISTKWTCMGFDSAGMADVIMDICRD